MNILSAALTTLSASPATGLLLAGELAAAAWMVERFARQTIKIRKQNQALAYERTFSRSLSLLNHEVYLLLRRSDTFPLYVAGDLPGLTGLTLEDMQLDIACFFQLMSAADAKTLRRMLEKWDRSAPLRMSFHSKRENRWLELCVLPAEDDRYTLLNLRDVSALRQQREEMAAQLEEAQAASQSKTEFLSRMSHEIRTPINGITGLMALTRTRLGGSNPAAEEYLTRAEDLSQHLLSVINDILDLSRIEAGKIELEQKSFDLYALGDQLRSMFQKTVEAKGLRFNLEFKNFTARYVVGDQLRITQVLVNFLSNAVKFTSQGEISVTFRQMMLSDDTVSFMVAVKDTGTGMDPKFINSIFRPFQQEDASIAKRFGGSGLGMAITDQLVRLMGARSWWTVCPDGAAPSPSISTCPWATAPPPWQPGRRRPTTSPSRAAASSWPRTTRPTPRSPCPSWRRSTGPTWRWPTTARRRWICSPPTRRAITTLSSWTCRCP